jgi:hypothetical protein
MSWIPGIRALQNPRARLPFPKEKSRQTGTFARISTRNPHVIALKQGTRVCGSRQKIGAAYNPLFASLAAGLNKCDRPPPAGSHRRYRIHLPPMR